MGGLGGQGAAGSAGKPQLTSCPEGLPGPALVFIEHGQRSYCIDTTEVTQGQYAQFLASTTFDASKLPARCAKDTTFEPRNQGDPADAECYQGIYDPTAKADYPVVCVDWCDAYAYCAWAGKRLCGAVEGGGAGKDKGTLLTAQWGFACSQGGKTAYPYGDTYQKGKCVDVDNPGDGMPKPASETSACRGSSPPFDAIYNMSGNVDEWEDACDDFYCRVRAGFTHPACAADLAGQVSQHAPGFGFRCCAD